MFIHKHLSQWLPQPFGDIGREFKWTEIQDYSARQKSFWHKDESRLELKASTDLSWNKS